MAAASFDFFLTAPHYQFAILQRDDIETAVLLLAIGVAVSEIAWWGRRQSAQSSQRAGYLSGVALAARLAADGSPTPERRGHHRRDDHRGTSTSMTLASGRRPQPSRPRRTRPCSTATEHHLGASHGRRAPRGTAGHGRDRAPRRPWWQGRPLPAHREHRRAPTRARATAGRRHPRETAHRICGHPASWRHEPSGERSVTRIHWLSPFQGCRRRTVAGPSAQDRESSGGRWGSRHRSRRPGPPGARQGQRPRVAGGRPALPLPGGRREC